MAKYLFVLTLVCISVPAHAGEERTLAPDGPLSFQFGNAETPVDRSLFYFPISRSLGINVDLDAKAKPPHSQTDPSIIEFFRQLNNYKFVRR